MIVFSRSQVILATQPDGTAPANFPAQSALRYDQISFVSNNVLLRQGDLLPPEHLQPEPSPLPKVQVVLTLTGGDGNTPPGIDLDHPTPIRVRAKLIVSIPNPTGDGTMIDVIPPVTGDWRIPFAGSASLYRKVTMTNGIAEFEITDIPEGGFYPATAYFDKISYGGQLYEVEIVGDPRFIGYRVAPEGAA